MSNTEFDASINLHAANIRRLNPKLSKKAARTIAAKMHFLVIYVREYLAYQRNVNPERHIEEADLLKAIVVPCLGDEKTASTDRRDLFDDIYLNCMRLCDETCGTDLVGQFGLDKDRTACIPRLQ